MLRFMFTVLIDVEDEGVLKCHPNPRATIANRTTANPTVSPLLHLLVLVEPANSHRHFRLKTIRTKDEQMIPRFVGQRTV